MKRLILGSAILATLAACTNVPATAPSPAAKQHMTNPSRVVYPLDKFELDERELQVVRRASYLLTLRCIQTVGGTLPPLPPGRLHLPRGEDRYGLTDEGRARSWAYSLDAPPATAMPWEAQVRPDTYLFRQMYEKPGCRTKAAHTLGQRRTKEKNPVDTLDELAWRRSRTDPDVRRAEARWLSCMRQRGYTELTEPVDAPNFFWGARRTRNASSNPAEKRNGVRPDRVEREAAVADVRCKQSSGFLRAWMVTDLAEQRHLIGQPRTHEILAEHRRKLDVLVQRAETVIAAQTIGPRTRSFPSEPTR
jgi:hypothetical protein